MITRHQIEVDGPLWNDAVALKRERAYRQCDRDGIAKSFYEPYYDAFARDKGRPLHDVVLRKQAEDNHVYGWVKDSQLVGFAVLHKAKLFGSEETPIMQVVDACVISGASRETSRAIVESIVEIADELEVMHWEMSGAGAALWEACEAEGGQCCQKTYHFKRKEFSESPKGEAQLTS